MYIYIYIKQREPSGGKRPGGYDWFGPVWPLGGGEKRLALR